MARAMTTLEAGWGSAVAALRRVAARRMVVMTRRDLELFVEPWYHDFRDLGLPTPQRPGIYPPNQAAKQPVLFRMIDQALEIARRASATPTMLELFCADGFYASFAARRGAHVVGIDTDSSEIAKARLAARLLGLRNAEFRIDDVLTSELRASVGICAGGLYHLADPEALLRRLRERIEKVLVIQTVFHLARTEPEYFETPAPGWTWGCRFSLPWLLQTTERCGWRIVHSEQNELTGNDRPEDRGSAYLLCVPESA